MVIFQKKFMLWTGLLISVLASNVGCEQKSKKQKDISMYSTIFQTVTYPYALPALLYAHNALEPYIDELTMQIHHGKHHQAYIDNLNKALKDYPDWQSKSLIEILMNLDQLPDAIRTTVRNNGGGHFNHTLFWEMMTPEKNTAPSTELMNTLVSSFGSVEKFKELFAAAGLTRFGSGWAWLCVNTQNPSKLVITSTANQDTTLADGLVPVLALDVWEHAYYLKYQNKRGDYLSAWWNVVNWNKVNEYYAKTLSSLTT